MISETICLLFVFIAGIVLIARLGFLSNLLSKFLGQKILDELSCLKVSAPNLKSTYDGNNSVSL